MKLDQIEIVKGREEYEYMITYNRKTVRITGYTDGYETGFNGTYEFWDTTYQSAVYINYMLKIGLNKAELAAFEAKLMKILARF